MTTKKFTTQEIKYLKIAGLARKHKCSEDYVRRVLKGERERNSELSQKILKDAIDMFDILERETTITV
ncbi:MAG TPA: hypothetical protein DIT04_07160 [Dysgonomonas sp.]|nr:hypothetical protein [Dysgonomonas sp.]